MSLHINAKYKVTPDSFGLVNKSCSLSLKQLDHLFTIFGACFGMQWVVNFNG